MSSRLIFQRSASTCEIRNCAHRLPWITSRYEGGKGPVPPRAFDAERDPAHRLDTAGDGKVVVAGDDTRRREVHGLLRRTALPVDGRARNVLRQAGRHPGVARDVGRLLADLARRTRRSRRLSAPDPPRALDQVLEREGEQVDRVPVGERPTPAPERRTDGVHDHRFALLSCPRHLVSLAVLSRILCNPVLSEGSCAIGIL